jgi:hypothetical protein
MFHYNKIALTTQNINLWLQLDALGTQLNLIVTVDGTMMIGSNSSTTVGSISPS